MERFERQKEEVEFDDNNSNYQKKAKKDSMKEFDFDNKNEKKEKQGLMKYK